MMRTLSDTLNRIILTKITDAQQKDAIRNLKPLSLVIIAVSTSLSVLSLGTAAKATTFEFEQKLLAPDGAVEDFFGFPVAIDGNLALIGANRDDDNGNNSGSAYLFDMTTGSLLQKFTAPDGANDDGFGISVAVNGNFALIGSSGDDDNGFNSGSAYLFDVNNGNLLHKFIAPDAAILDRFGESTAIDGNFVLIHSNDDDNGGDSGAVYLFNATSGDLIQKFIAPDGVANDDFGQSMAILGDLALIGSPSDDDNGTDSGSAYLFNVTTGDLLQKLTAPDGTADDRFGFSVAMDENLALIGSFLDDDNGINSGSAYLFDITSGDLLQKFIAPDGDANDDFGRSVDINGNHVLIGSRHDDDNGTDSGSAYLFDVANGSLIQKFTAFDGAINDDFGWSVAIDGNNILIGSIFDDDNGTDSGSAYLFTVESVPPESVPEPSSIIGIISLLGLGALVKKR